MPLGMEVGLGPGHIVLDGDPALRPLKRGHSPLIFAPCLLWSNGWMDQHVTWYEGRPQPRPHCYMGTQLPTPKTGTAPNFRLMSVVVKRSPILVTAEHLLYMGTG